MSFNLLATVLMFLHNIIRRTSAMLASFLLLCRNQKLGQAGKEVTATTTTTFAIIM